MAIAPLFLELSEMRFEYGVEDVRLLDGQTSDIQTCSILKPERLMSDHPYFSIY